MLLCATGERTFFDPSRMHVLDHKGDFSRSGARSTSRGRSRAGRSSSKPALPKPAASSLRRLPRWCSQRRERSPTACFLRIDIRARAAALGRDPDHFKSCRRLCRVGDTSTKRGRTAPGSIVSSMPRAPSPRCPSRSATTPRRSTRTGRSRISPRRTPARADASGPSRSPGAKTSLCASSRKALGRLCGPGVCRHRRNHRRRHAGMVRGRRRRWLQHHVPASARGARPLCRSTWCRSCSVASCFALPMKDKRCAKISVCQGQFASRRETSPNVRSRFRQAYTRVCDAPSGFVRPKTVTTNTFA